MHNRSAGGGKSRLQKRTLAMERQDTAESAPLKTTLDAKLHGGAVCVTAHCRGKGRPVWRTLGRVRWIHGWHTPCKIRVKPLVVPLARLPRGDPFARDQSLFYIMKTKHNSLSGPRPFSQMGRQTKLLTGLAAGTCAVFLFGCRDRNEDIVRTDTTATENREALASNTPSSASPATTTPDATPSAGTNASGPMSASSETSSGSQLASNQHTSARGGAEVQDRATIALDQEKLNVEKKEVDAGGVLVSKEVVTEEVQQPVQLERERVQITHVSPDEAPESDQAISEDQIYIPLKKEEAVAQKEVTTSGAIEVAKQTETEEQTVSDTVRREVADIQREGEAELSETTQVASTDNSQNSQSGFATVDDNTQPAAEPQDLEQRIRDSLRQESSLALSEDQLEQIEIEVDQDTVRLSGAVSDQEKARQIEDRIRQVDGVKMVQNELEPEQTTQAAE